MIVTLSRQLGSQGDIIAARVAAALGLLIVDREYVSKAARMAGVPDELLRKLMYEGRRSLASELLDSLAGPPAGLPDRTALPPNPLDGIFAPRLMPASIDPDEGVRTIGLVIKDTASRDNILVLGQGAQMWLRDYRGACHVQVVAPLELRMERVAARENISRAAARRRVRANDQARADYLARYHGVNWLDPMLYHLVINTGLTHVEAAVSLIVHAAQVVERDG